MPDLNTGNSYVQQRALGLLEECIDCGVDGFRFDAAKHIELPTDPSSCKSDFWENVIDGASSYAEENNKDVPFYYGEILGGAGTDISNYTTYMAVTDNYTSDLALDKAYYSAASELADSTYYKGAGADKSVLWVESHDTYMGSAGSAAFSNTKSITNDVINKAWAVVGARANSTSLFFARPNDTMGAASSDTNWKSTAVAEVNKFKNHFVGTSEYLSSSGNSAYVERGTKGVVISKLDGSGSVNLTAHQMASGTYTDQVTGNTFTVANGKISGTVGSTGVAVVYNADDDAISYITEPTLYLKPNSNWTSGNARFAMYVYNSVEGGDAWVSMTSTGDGYYSADVPSTQQWTNVIFCSMNGSNQTNNWDNKVYQTNNLFPDSGTNCYTVASGTWDKGGGSWSLYSNSQQTTTVPVTEPTTQESTTPPSDDTYTIYAIDNAGWNTNDMHVYYWNNDPQWPGNAMTSVSGTKVYKCEVPKDISGLIFNIGSNTKQTVDITSGFKDGAVFTINSSQNNGKYLVDVFYLVGDMNGWSNNDNYSFSYESYDSNKLTYKLSGVQLTAGQKMKIHSTNSADDGSDTWYPGGSNNDYEVTATGIYDIYFRPNGDGNSDWHDADGKYFYVVNVTQYEITWKDGDGKTLKTETLTYGDTPAYTGATPTKSADSVYHYTFNNTWSPELDTVTKDETYTAQFNGTRHTFREQWTWANDYKSATLTLSCNDCELLPDTIVTTDIVKDCQADKTVYTAYAVYNGVEYTDSVNTEVQLFAGHSLTLKGDIGVNFFINVSEEDVDNGVTVNYTWTVAGNEKHASYTLDKTRDCVKDHRYKATCYVAAAEMTYPITATITINNELQDETNTYTVKQYADKILNDQRFINSYTATYGAAKYNKLNTLVKSMLDYGTRAQISFDRTEPGLANGGEYYLNYAVNASDIEAPVNNMKDNLSTYGLEYAGSTVVYLSETTLRHYYRITNTETFNIYKNSITIDGEAIKYKTSDDGLIYFDVKNISANDMGITHTLTIGNNSYQYSVLTYIKKAIDRQTTSESTKEICKAAYRYYTAAVDYFA